MKKDFKHDQMVCTLVVRVFPEIRRELERMAKLQPERWRGASEVARSALMFALNNPKFEKGDII